MAKKGEAKGKPAASKSPAPKGGGSAPGGAGVISRDRYGKVPFMADGAQPP